MTAFTLPDTVWIWGADHCGLQVELSNEHSGCVRYVRAERAEAERDAIAAAAFEASAKLCDDAKLCGGEYDLDLEEAIRALAPAEAKAALDRLLTHAKAEGMREAAEVADRIEQLERELVEARDDARDFSALASELTGKLEAERALADRLHKGARIYGIRAGEQGNTDLLDALAAHSKAREGKA